MPLGGITGGTQSILSYNYGAYRTERVRQAQKYIFGLGLVFTASVMTLAARLAGPLFVRLFTTDEALAAQGVRHHQGYARWRCFPWACNTRWWTASRHWPLRSWRCRFRCGARPSTSRRVRAARVFRLRTRCSTPSPSPILAGRWPPSPCTACASGAYWPGARRWRRRSFPTGKPQNHGRSVCCSHGRCRKSCAFAPSRLRTGPAASFAAHRGLRRPLRSARLGTGPARRRGVI